MASSLQRQGGLRGVQGPRQIAGCQMLVDPRAADPVMAVPKKRTSADPKAPLSAIKGGYCMVGSLLG